MPTKDPLRRVVQNSLGSSHQIISITPLRGGTKKRVYRAALENTSVVVYAWDQAENYWSDESYPDGEDVSDPFSAACGKDLFVAAHQRLQSLDVRTPDVYLVDTSKSDYPIDIVIVEDVQGGALGVSTDPRGTRTRPRPRRREGSSCDHRY